MTRILIADAHEVVRVGLRKILETHARRGQRTATAVRKAAETGPDIAVVGYSLPLLNDLVLTTRRGAAATIYTSRIA